MVSKKIVVVGSINLDLVARVARMPQAGETLTGDGFAMIAGGKGANQAVGAARLGGEVVMIGRLGNDNFAETMRRGLEEAGVETRCVLNVAGPSGVALITVDERGGNSIVVIPGANAELKPMDLEGYGDELRGAAVILAQLEVPIETVVHVAGMAAEAGVPFVLDPAPARALPDGLLRVVTWLTPNESETRSVLEQLEFRTEAAEGSEEWLEEAAQKILSSGVRYVALKLGERGVYLAGRDVRSELIPAFAVDALDTTAAGDAFNAGLAYALTEGLEPSGAAEFASAVAAISVTRRGAQPSMPRLDEVRELAPGYPVGVRER